MLNKHTILSLTLIAAFGVAGVNFMPAVEANADHPTPQQAVMATISGTIASVDLPNDSFVLKPTDSDAVTLKVNDATSYTMDGLKSSKEAVLKANAKATVSHIENLAMLVAAETAAQ